MREEGQLSLIRVGFLGALFEVRGVDIWRLESTHTYVVSEIIPFSIKVLLIFLMSAVFCKGSAFYGQNSTFTQSNSVRVVLEIFYFCFQIL